MVPVGDGPWVLADVCRHLETQPNVPARDLYLRFFIRTWTSDESYLDFETRAPHRMLMQVSEHSGLPWGATEKFTTCMVKYEFQKCLIPLKCQ